MLSLQEAQSRVSRNGGLMKNSRVSARRWGGYLCTQAQTLFRRYSGLDCSAETMARREEKFLRIRHSCRTTHTIGNKSTNWKEVRGRRSAHLSHVDPALDEPRAHVRPELPVLQHRADHARRHGVELSDGGSDGGSAVLVVLFVPLGPDGAQAVVRYDLFEQKLDKKSQVDAEKLEKNKKHWKTGRPARPLLSRFPPLTASM